MKKSVITGALAAAVTVGLVAAPKAEASSAKYTIKQYRTVKKYKHGMKATFSYQLPQLKGNSAAVKKINKDLKKSYSTEKKNSKTVFYWAKHFSKQDSTVFFNETFHDTNTASMTYNKNNIISFKNFNFWYAGGAGETTFGGWTYSLQTGKKLNIYHVARGSHASVKKKLIKGAKKLGADGFLLSESYLMGYGFFLKSGKVYVYPRVSSAASDKFFTLPARYK